MFSTLSHFGAFLSYFGANWVLVVLVLLGTVALGYVAFILRNWKLAVGAVVLVCVGLAYQKANMDGYKRRVNEEAQAQIKVLNGRLDALQHVAAEDALRAQRDSTEIAQLKKLASETPKNDSACLDVDAARRVRAIR